MSLSARLRQFAVGEDAALDAAVAAAAADLARMAEELEVRVRALEALAELLPDEGPLRVGVRRFDRHVVAWIDTPGGAREGSGHTLADALLSAATAGKVARRSGRSPRHSGL